MSGEAHTGLVVLQIVGAAAGLLILGGLWTPMAGVLAGIVEAWIGLSQPGIQSSALILASPGHQPGDDRARRLVYRCAAVWKKAASSAGALSAARVDAEPVSSRPQTFGSKVRCIRA